MAKILNEIISHTLKTPDGRWSRMSIIITSSWAVVLFMALADYFMYGFNYSVWIALLSTAVGTKLVDAQAKSILPKNETTSNDNTIK